MRAPLRTLLAASVAAGCLLVGCSSDGGDDTATTTTRATTSNPTTTAPGDDDATTTSAGGRDTTTTEGPSGSTTTGSAGGDDALCAALKEIRSFDEASEKAVSESTSWAEMQKVYVEGTPKVLDAYDDAIAASDGTVKDDLQALRDYTEPAGDIAREATSLEDFGSELAGVEGLAEAGEAATRLDSYSRDTCGFGTSSTGD